MLKTSVFKHLAAFIYDVFPVFGILIVSSGLTLIFRGGNDVEARTWWFQALILFEIAFYYIYFWKVGGQTIGMKAWKITIKPNNSQANLSWTQAIIRFVVGVVSTLLLGTGLFWKLFSKNKSSWMDSASSSTTIYYETED